MPEALSALVVYDPEADVEANLDEMNEVIAEVRTGEVTRAVRDSKADIGPIAAGDWVMLNYTAANLDPSIFDDPLVFDVVRPNADKHIAFGLVDWLQAFQIGSHRRLAQQSADGNSQP